MTDEQLRALVRDAVARRLAAAALPEGARPCGPDAVAAPVESPSRKPAVTFSPRAASSSSAPTPWQHHPSHHVYLTVINTSDACVIEPTVSCDHCGYCKSHGH
jgi:hypothetical protein